jgi:hypothetical protein
MKPVVVPPDAKIPSLTRRVIIGSLRLIPLLLVYVVIPAIGIQRLQSLGISSGFPLLLITVAGAILAILGTARYIAKPTRAFGPLSIAASGAGILYLLSFAPYASATISVGSGGTVEIVYGMLLAIAAIVPVFGLAAGVVVTVEDAQHPGERLPFDYPRPAG